MSKQKTFGKLNFNKETLRELVDLSKVHGAQGDEQGFINIKVSVRKAQSVSLIACCCDVKG
jgi:hypothetical protein